MPNIADVMELPGQDKFYFYTGYFTNMRYVFNSMDTPGDYMPISGVIGFDNKINPAKCYAETIKMLYKDLTEAIEPLTPEGTDADDIYKNFRVYFVKFEQLK